MGLTIAIAGLLFIGLIGWRILPPRTGSAHEIGAQFEIGEYITEVRIPANSPYVGRRVTDLESLASGDAAIVALERRGDRMLAPSAYLRLQADDVLILEADTSAIDRIVAEADLDNVGTANFSEINLRSERVGLTEAVITPGSRLEGGTAQSLSLHTRFGVNLLGIARQGHTIHDRLGQVRLTIGDVLLLQGERRTMPEALAALGCLPLAGREITIRPRQNRYLVLGVFATALLVVALGLAAPAIAFVGAVAALVISRSIDLQEVYMAIDWPVIILLGALIPVGMALEATGGSEIVASPILAGGQPHTELGGPGAADVRHHVALGRHEQRRHCSAHGAHRHHHRVGPERQRRPLSHGRGHRQLLDLPDAGGSSIEPAGHGAGRLSLRRLLAARDIPRHHCDCGRRTHDPAGLATLGLQPGSVLGAAAHDYGAFEGKHLIAVLIPGAKLPAAETRDPALSVKRGAP